MSGKTNEKTFYDNGLRFSCKRCSACCRHDAGIVLLNDADLQALCATEKLTREQFIQVYCKEVYTAHNGVALSLKEKSNYDCIFWAETQGGCKIYENRPLQCKTFPFWASVIASKEAWDACALTCPGMNSGMLHTKEQIEKMLA
ncbi:MAG: YkgJ family cysteine cluster protein [Treponemataceae bacterium]|nr:MAG: YkgJ family cysteine cluster protein [Treponemataceae bacterium]